MDSITQAALGAAVGELTLGRQLGNKAWVWGALVGTLPDLDVFLSPLLDPAARLTWHRGLSHSILLVLLGSLVIAWGLWARYRKAGVSFGHTYTFASLNWATHVLIDCFTTYGTQIFEPFDHQRIALNNLFIVDVFFTSPLLLAPLIYLFLNRRGPWRRRLNGGALAWCCLYVGLSFAAKEVVSRKFGRDLATRDITPVRVFTTPTISNIVLWRCLAETETGYWIGYRSLFDAPDSNPRFTYVPRNRRLISDDEETPTIAGLMWFSRGCFTIREAPGGLLFSDLRFGEVRNGLTDEIEHLFTWRITRGPSGKVVGFTPVRARGVNARQIVGSVWERILGNKDGW